MIAPPSYLYEVSSARAPEGFHSVKEEPQRKDFQVDFPFENPTAKDLGFLSMNSSGFSNIDS